MSNNQYQANSEERPLVAQEPVAVYLSVNQRTLDSRRCDVSRAITGDELLSRLRPRIKSLFE